MIRTLLRVGPTLRIRVLTACIGGLSPTSASRSPCGVELPPQGLVLEQEPAIADQAVDLGQQLLEDHRLHQVVVRPAAERGDGVLDRGVGRDHDERASRAGPGASGSSSVEAVGAGKLDVAEDDVGLERLDQRQRRSAVASADGDLEPLALEEFLEGRGDHFLVVDDQDRGPRCRLGTRGRSAASIGVLGPALIMPSASSRLSRLRPRVGARRTAAGGIAGGERGRRRPAGAGR